MPVGRLVLDKNPRDYFAEVEQAAFGTGVLVDGLQMIISKQAIAIGLLKNGSVMTSF
ncbi:catalase [Nostoc sp. CHAB 5715]|uniref:catalase n=1 Tax=Nostoc sp. CHAB 5715 TaxID=2780400 RepID=UPI00279537C7|nr:catalase [Nostoc sp. CHAB 5715]